MTKIKNIHQPESRPPLPRFLMHVALLWQTRIQMISPTMSRFKRNAQLAVSGFVIFPCMVLVYASYWFMNFPPVANEIEVSQFYLNLLCFVTAMLWVSWPLLSASIEDSSESSRYNTFPISGWRLLVSSILAECFRPNNLLITAPLIGACLGYAHAQQIEMAYQMSSLLVIALLLAFIAMCATWSQVAMFLVRDAMRSKHSGEWLMMSMLVIIVVGAVHPKVDITWLYEQATRLAEGGGVGIDIAEFARIATAFSYVPPGYLGEGMRALVEGRMVGVAIELFGLFSLALLGLFFAKHLLVYAQQTSREGAAPVSAIWRNLFSDAGSPTMVLMRREALELWRNPRVRLLVSVPIVFLVVFHLVSGHELLTQLVGPNIDIWLMGLMGLYSSTLLLNTFSINLFAYDGRGILLLLSLPVTSGQLLQAKAMAHGLLTVGTGWFTCLFYWFYISTGGITDLLLSMLGIIAMVPVSIMVGIFVSIAFPVHLDASLNRRQRQPLFVTLVGFSSSMFGGLPFIVCVHWVEEGGAIAPALAALFFTAIMLWIVANRFFPKAADYFDSRREDIVSAVTRS